MGGFEPPLDRLSTCCLCLGWATWPLVPPGGVGPPPHGSRARHAALTPQRVGADPGNRTQTSAIPGPQASVKISSGANGGIRTRTSRLGRPAGSRYPTFALVRPTGIEPVSPRWRRGMHLHTQAERGPVLLTGPSPFRRFSKIPLSRARGGKGFEPDRSPGGEWGYGPSADHPLVPPVLATAPGLEPGPTSFGGSDASPTPRCRCRFTPRLSRRHNLPVT